MRERQRTAADVRPAVFKPRGVFHSAAPVRALAIQQRRFVVLTDGVSNQGIDPLRVTPDLVAAKVKVQTIGIALRNGNATVAGEPVGGVDEATLTAIASATGGKYFYAQAAGELQSIYSTLATQVGWQFQQVNLMVPLLISGIGLVMLGALVSLVWFRVLP